MSQERSWDEGRRETIGNGNEWKQRRRFDRYSDEFFENSHYDERNEVAWVAW